MASLERRSDRFRIVFRYAGRKFQHPLRTGEARPTNSTSLVFSTPSGSSKRGQRPVEEALPQAGERPGPEVLGRRRQFAVDVACPHQFVEQGLGL